VLPDDVLLEIFDFYVDEYQSFSKGVKAWHLLVHVCRQWRSVVFGSPRRLNLRLVGTNKTPVKDTLGVWPPLPLVIRKCAGQLTEGVDNIIALLKHRDRVDDIELTHINSSSLEKVLAAMQEPFPELTDLLLKSDDKTVPVLPDSFLGGSADSAPRLRYLVLDGIPFPGLPKLLSSATHLVTLYLDNIPHSGYISPQSMAIALSELTDLKSLRLNFQSPRSYPDRERRRPSPPTRTVLPVLTRFWFKGVCEYLDDLVALINAPQLDHLDMTFFNQITFDTPQFIQFIGRTPALGALETARVVFGRAVATVNFSSRTSDYGSLNVGIPCRELDWQVSSLEQVCTSCLPRLSTGTSEDLYIYERPFWQAHWKDNIENALWLDLLHPFTAVKSLYLSNECARRIGPALAGGTRTEMLPNLQNIFLEGFYSQGQVPKDIGKFIAARQVSSHPITVSHWSRDKTMF
jgi:hypothetical protein